MIWLEIAVREAQTHKQWIPVVPDYIYTNLLLGCDILGQAFKIG